MELLRNNNGEQIMGLNHVDFVSINLEREGDHDLKHWEQYLVSLGVPCYVTQHKNRMVLWKEDEAIRQKPIERGM